MDKNQTIANVINTLNQITVSGSQNMNRLLGCILALEGLLKEPEEKAEETNE